MTSQQILNYKHKEEQKMSEGKSKKISLTVNNETLREMQQFMSEKRITLTELINSILVEYVNTHKSSMEDGDRVQA